MNMHIKEKIKSQKITGKITFIVFLFTFVPTMIVFFVVVNNVKKSAINDQMDLLKMSMNQNYSQLQKSIELCNLSTQVFLNNPNLIEFIERIKSGEEMDIKESMDFYRNDIASMESIVNSNPYLYQIRVYVDSNQMMEMMPILYQKKRMERLEWAKGEVISQTWHYNYSDTIFPKHVTKTTEHIMSLTTLIPSYTYGSLGVIEVAIHMDTVFPGIFENSTSKWVCFVDENNIKYYDKSKENQWSPYVNDIFAKIDKKSIEDRYFVSNIAGEDVIIGVKLVDELGGEIVTVVSLKNVLRDVNRFWRIYSLFLIMILGILIIVIKLVVKTGSKRFYTMMQSLHEVQKGNLDVVVPDCGTDEIGELAEQMNIMLRKIKQLMEDNINRELLLKNSEIRALQNQINAHFIYNVLESVKMMAEVDEQYDISDAVTSLGRMLRYNMKGLAKNVTVEEEVNYIKNYITLMNLRYDYEIYLSINIPDALWKEEIPKMSLQPIVENSITHGIEDIAEDTNIYIKGILMEDYFIIEISDQGKGMEEEELKGLRIKINARMETSGGSGKGIGLKNVQDRIRIHFGEEYGLSISSKWGCYTKVSMKIPRKLI
jgi:two-component system sensor histidine kinase YesM